MQPARLDRWITIQQPVETQHATGEMIVSRWSTFAAVWAEKLDTGGSERFGGAIIAAVTTNWKIWWLDGVTAKMRVRYEVNGAYVYYNILVIQEVGNREGMLLKTETQDHGCNT